MRTFDLNKLVRENIKRLTPYSSARDEYKGSDGLFLDANENSLGSPIDDITENVNRYPDPFQSELKEKISKVKGIPANNIFIGNGSDEVIDLILRAFCEPGRSKILVCPPTYGMYQVAASINDIEVKKVNLIPESFEIDAPEISNVLAADELVRVLFLCSPNNPTGNMLSEAEIRPLIKMFNGVVVIDEAYINFSSKPGFCSLLAEYPNLIILQTLSKAWGMAGLRVGMAFASSEIIAVLNKIKPPYNVNAVSQQLAIQALDNIDVVNNTIKELVSEREKLKNKLGAYSFVVQVYPSEANFILVKTTDPKGIYQFLVERKIIVRDRSTVSSCEGCLRITVGTPAENELLLKTLSDYEKK